MNIRDATKAAILRERARVLAQVVETPPAPETLTELVVFVLSGEDFAIRSTLVREVLVRPAVTPVPCAPPFVAGIINMRGQIVPVVVLRDLLHIGLSADAVDDVGRIIVVRAAGADVGIKVDGILGVRRIPSDAARLALSHAPRAQAGFVQRVSSEQLSIVDIERLLADPAPPAERFTARSTDGPLDSSREAMCRPVKPKLDVQL